jgi:hypothetical protein
MLRALKSAVLAAAAASTSVALTLLLGEAALRLVPGLLPSGGYGSGRVHPGLGTSVHAGPAVYNKVRRLERVPNREGFMDADHARTKPAGVVRVGFFGDSYVESLQVPLEATFFRQLANAPLEGVAVEPLAFGISGWGTLHALRAYQELGPAYDLDVAVYLFVENDLGDQLQEVAERMGGASKPLARLHGDGYAIAVPAHGGHSIARGIAKELQGNSLLAQVVWARLLALRRGPAASASSAASEIPNANDLAARWRPEVAERAKRLGALVLADFARAAEHDGVHFAVLYVPRGEEQLGGETPRDQTFAPWLFGTCAQLRLHCIDPSSALAAAHRGGEAMYDDHWSPAGHAVIAEVLREALAETMRARRAR